MATERRDFSNKSIEPSEEMAKMLFVKRRCCFCIPCFRSNRSPTVGLYWWQKMRMTKNEEGWWARGINGVKKLRQWSEIVAGPRWKTFIRRFNRNKSRGGGSRHGKFQYDPLSYALNFDEGLGQNGNSEDEAEDGVPKFSSRYASFSMSSMPLWSSARSWVCRCANLRRCWNCWFAENMLNEVEVALCDVIISHEHSFYLFLK